MSEQDEKELMNRYTLIFVNKLKEAVHEEIGTEELVDADKCTMMFHCMANMAPGYMYIHLTGKSINALGFSHVANSLCFRYHKNTEEPEAAGQTPAHDIDPR
jgi:hypothetical protein